MKSSGCAAATQLSLRGTCNFPDFFIFFLDYQKIRLDMRTFSHCKILSKIGTYFLMSQKSNSMLEFHVYIFFNFKNTVHAKKSLQE